MKYRIGGRLESWLDRRTEEQVRSDARRLAVNTTQSFGERLRVLRQFAGLFQRDIVQYLGWPQDRMSDLECGRINAADTELEQLAEFFGVPSGDLRE
jgi:ribosome-binding protein aMBF1 (putative translation factor)